MDRGYVDFERHYALHQEAAFFVTHATRTLTKFQIHWPIKRTLSA